MGLTTIEPTSLSSHTRDEEALDIFSIRFSSVIGEFSGSDLASVSTF